MVTLYSTGCPKCNILEGRLTKDNIEFSISDDVDKLIEMGFQTAPILQINDEYLEFGDAMRKLKAFEDGKGVIE